MTSKKKRFVFLIYFVFVIPGLFFLAEDNIGFFIDRRLNKDNVEVSSTGADFSLLSRSVAFDKISFTHPEYGCITFVDLQVEKINLLSMLPTYGFRAGAVSMDSLILDLNHVDQDSSSTTFELDGKHFGVDKLDIGFGRLRYAGKDRNAACDFTLKALKGYSDEGVSQGFLTVHDLSHESFSDATLTTLDSLWMNLDMGQLSAKGLEYKSTLDKVAFAQSFPYQKDRLDLTIPHFWMSGLSLGDWGENGVSCERASVDSARLMIYKDKRLVEQTDKADVRLLIDRLRDIPLMFHMDTVTVVHAAISHEERHHAQKPGRLRFDNLYASIYGLSSQHEKPVSVDAQALFQQQGKVKAHFELNSSPARNKVKGTLSAMDMTRVNDITVPAAGLLVESGDLYGLAFDFEYDDEAADGKVDMRYENLSLQFVDSETQQQNFNQSIKSFLTNTLKVRSKNHEELNNYRTGLIAYQRDKTKFEVGYWWQSLFSGIKSSISLVGEPDRKS